LTTRFAARSKPYEQRVEIPAGLTEDEAVASIIEQYKQSTGIELADAVVRADVRAQMNGRDTTPRGRVRFRPSGAAQTAVSVAVRT
jgi:hypothetical protein